MPFIGTKNRRWKEIAVEGPITEKARELGIMGIEVRLAKMSQSTRID